MPRTLEGAVPACYARRANGFGLGTRPGRKGHTMHAGMLALLGPIGLPELIIILFIMVLVFGAKRLSGLGRGMGQAIRGFKDEIQTDDQAEAAPKAKVETD